MNTTADGNGIILLDWLRLLGWKVEIRPDGDHWVGLARHAEANGSEIRVGGRATGASGLVWELFTGAVDRLESRSRAPMAGALRAA